MATTLDHKTSQMAVKHDVGGLALDRPFRIRRLGHFGFNVQDVDACTSFYRDLLGFQISDPIDFGSRIKDEKRRAELGNTVGYFLRHGTDHHSFVVFPKPVLDEMGGRPGADRITINQITWQVGSLREVADATAWFRDTGTGIRRTGRDMPGSNWHVYPLDPEGHINELYYGIEQIGWDGRSKPRELHKDHIQDTPDLPYISEYQEVEEAVGRDVDVFSGYRHDSTLEAEYDVGGILLERPFKVVRIGPLRVFVDDMAAMEAYYRERLGLGLTEEVTWNGHRCVFLRANTDHHSLALYPMALRNELGLSNHTTCMSFGLQVANYRQLKDAIGYLEDNGVEIKYLPPELSSGIDYSAFAIDPDGHALELYYYMEQVGWDGRPRPADLRRQVDNAKWPDTLDPMEDSFLGEAFLGPWG